MPSSPVVPTQYRSHTGYRSHTPYRGYAPAPPAYDYQREDGISVFVFRKDGTFLTELPGADVLGVSWTRCDSGDADISLSLVDPGSYKVQLADKELLIVFWEHLHPDGTPVVWRGNAWQAGHTKGVRTLKCRSLEEWFRHRVVENASLVYGTPTAGVDQFSIAADLVYQCQNYSPNHNLYIGTSFLPCGKTRSRSYKRDQHQIIFDLLTEFTDLNQGFDWEVWCDQTGLKQFRMYYLGQGTVTPYVFEYDSEVEEDGNILDYSLDVDFTGGATKVYAQGKANAEAHYEDLWASNKHGAMLAVVNKGDQQSTPFLLDVATRTTVLRANPTAQIDVTVSDTWLGKVWKGDTVWVDIHDGFLTFKRQFRIKTLEWKPGALHLVFDEPRKDVVTGT
jgi:hypothetical protein